MRRHTRSQRLAMSNIPNTPGKPAFDELWKAVRLHLRSEPSSSIGVMGPQKGGGVFPVGCQISGQRHWAMLLGLGGSGEVENR